MTVGNSHPVRPSLEPLLEGFKRAGRSRSSGYRQILAGQFPAPVKIGRRSFLVTIEVDEWIAERIAERDHGGVQ